MDLFCFVRTLRLGPWADTATPARGRRPAHERDSAPARLRRTSAPSRSCAGELLWKLLTQVTDKSLHYPFAKTLLIGILVGLSIASLLIDSSNPIGESSFQSKIMTVLLGGFLSCFLLRHGLLVLYGQQDMTQRQPGPMATSHPTADRSWSL